MANRAKRQVKVSHEYRFGPRSVLAAGDQFRVTGGPVYVTVTGEKISLAERGVFTFCRYCQQASTCWIEAHREGDCATIILVVSRARGRPMLPNLRRRPYRVVGKIGVRRYQRKSKVKP